MIRAPFQGQMTHGSFKILVVSSPQPRLCWQDSLYIWYNDIPWATICSTKLPGQRPLAKITRVISVVSPWLCTYSTDLLRVLHRYNPWGDDVLCTISGRKDKFQGYACRSYVKCWPLAAIIRPYINLLLVIFLTSKWYCRIFYIYISF